jgi:PAS domain-containing protein
METNAVKALSEGASGYQQEFRIIGPDGVHWLSEEVIIKPYGPDEWNLAGVVIDVTKRHEAEEARKSTEGQLDQILKGADCLLWQAIVTGDPDVQLFWQMFIPASVLYKRIVGEDSAPLTTGSGRNRRWRSGRKSRRPREEGPARGPARLRAGVPRKEQGKRIPSP